jgi:IS5 family transposase
MTLQIVSIVCRKGHVHDFRILKDSKIKIHPDIKKIGDSGYQGMDELYPNSQTPIKKTKNRPLTKADKKYNRALSKQRVRIENVNRRCKIFRIAKETYRGKHKNYSKTWNIIAGLVNLRYAA